MCTPTFTSRRSATLSYSRARREHGYGGAARTIEPPFACLHASADRMEEVRASDKRPPGRAQTRTRAISPDPDTFAPCCRSNLLQYRYLCSPNRGIQEPCQ